MTVTVDNILGLLPEAVAAKVDELLGPKWDMTGQLRGSVVWEEIMKAYWAVGINTSWSREWSQPDVFVLYANNQIFVSR